MIDLMPNMTFFAQLGILVLTLLILNFLVFKPVLKILDKRRTLTEGFRQETSKLDDDTQALVDQYEAKMKTAREKGLETKNHLNKEGEGQAKEIIKQARFNVEKQVEASQQKIVAEANEAQKVLKQRSQELSVQMAEKLLGRKVEH